MSRDLSGFCESFYDDPDDPRKITASSGRKHLGRYAWLTPFFATAHGRESKMKRNHDFWGVFNIGRFGFIKVEISWLVVWLPFFVFSQKYWVSNHPNWRTPSFFRGVGIQPPTRNQCKMTGHKCNMKGTWEEMNAKYFRWWKEMETKDDICWLSTTDAFTPTESWKNRTSCPKGAHHLRKW